MLVFFGVLVITFTNLNSHAKPPVLQREDPWDTLGELVGDTTTLGTITNMLSFPRNDITFEEMIFPNFPFGGICFLVPWRVVRCAFRNLDKNSSKSLLVGGFNPFEKY